MSEFLQAATKSDLKDGEKMLAEVDERLVILFQVGDDYFCIDDGEHEGFEIACPRHGAKFDIRCGKALCMPATQGTVAHEVKVDGDSILVKINE